MEEMISSNRFPELIVGIAGPIGVDIEALCKTISAALREANYQDHLIKLTDEMVRFEPDKHASTPADFYDQINSKMERANSVRKHYKSREAMARIAIDTIVKLRRAVSVPESIPLASTAYIIRQLKLPEEVFLLRKVYGRQFILVSAYASEAERLEALEMSLSQSSSTDISPAEINYRAAKLIARDAKEDEEYGQNLGETFHLADVFTHGLRKKTMEKTIQRFFRAFFGKNDISPSKDEFGLYAAKSAALRSADLSRQVGAAIFSDDGELITQGCNEVPRAMGGNYWDGDDPDNRDVAIGYDPNDKLKKEVLRNIIERLENGGHLSESLTNIGNAFEIVEHLVDGKEGLLNSAKIMDLTEYGRVVHAEMNAICDAARMGRSVKGTTLFCTTFPCHSCAKHIIAAGVKRVVFLEPYPKSRAYELYASEIQVEDDQDPTRVSFVPFLGISPYRYRDIFQKAKRKTRGKADLWYWGYPRPMLEIEFPSYSQAETWALRPIYGELAEDPGG